VINASTMHVDRSNIELLQNTVKLRVKSMRSSWKR